jgi:23S rRNA (pseudouridine1915-N3)-methyltransferase
MKITLAAVVPRRSRAKSDAFEGLIAEYVGRAARYVATETQVFETEAALLAWLAGGGGRVAPVAVLLDSRGRQVSSEELAAMVASHRDQGTQRLVLAIGPADGWSDAARGRASGLLSLGRMTLPHQLARVVLAEQVYRALSILAGHPYHCGH